MGRAYIEGQRCTYTVAVTERRVRHQTTVQTLPVLQPRLLEPPCASREGALPDGCPGWCEFSDPDPDALFYDGPDSPEMFTAGTRLPGPIRLVQPIGDGGMGTVYVAVQEEPRRKVALKLMKQGIA